MSALLPTLLALMMFTMGLATTRGDFQRVLSIPQLIAVGVLCQLALLPVLGFLVASVVPMSDASKLGFMVICLCPGGILSNFVAYQARGSVPLSISLTLFSSVVTVFSIPLLLDVARALFGMDSAAISLPFVSTMLTLAKLTLAPLLCGIVLNHLWPTVATKVARVSSPVCSLGLVSYILYLWYMQRGQIYAAFQEVGLAVLLLVFAAAVSAYLITRALKFNRQYRATIVIETCIQNSALAFTVTMVLLNSPAMSMPTAFYTVAMFIPAMGLIFLSRRYQEH
jgi:BASS family bile acid:Na+ symporter